MKALQFVLVVSLAVVSCRTDSKKSVKLETKSKVSKEVGKSDSSPQRWVTGVQLQNVESVVYDSENDVYYASCGKEYRSGTEGFISKLSSSGNLLELKWVKDLNRPTGMAIHNGLLYVADFNRLLVIDLKTAKIIKTIPEHLPNSGLNDVAVNENGEVFVTGSFAHSVFQLQENHLETFARDDERLKWANGIAFSGDNLIVGGTHLNRINKNSAEIILFETNPPVVDIDGIVIDDTGNFYATTVDNSSLWYIDMKGLATKIASDSMYYYGDLDFNPNQKKLVIARGSQKTNTFFIESLPTIR